jgi:twitching motility protein PilT
MNLRIILEKASALYASDIHCQPEQPPVLRIDGNLHILDIQTLSNEDTRDLACELFTPKDFKKLSEEKQEIDTSFSLIGLGRYRVNAYHQNGTISLALRCLNEFPPKLEEIGLPLIVEELACKRSGLILVTGPTGSGKSTTLAAIIQKINETADKHILTIEDPVEYLHTPIKSIISQREIGRDTTSFAAALRAALRQDPDVILVGEMRDLETIQTALTASETGHLVLSTLHTNGAAETINRIVDVFPPHQQQQIRVLLAANLQGIVSQQLLPLSNGTGRVAATEILISTAAIRNLIREGKNHQRASALTTGSKHGMQSMDQSLSNLHQAGQISEDTLSSYASETDTMIHNR